MALLSQSIAASRKRKTVDPTPGLSTLKEGKQAGGSKRKALEEMTRVSELADYAGRTTMPAQLAALLHEPLICHAIALDPERTWLRIKTILLLSRSHL